MNLTTSSQTFKYLILRKYRPKNSIKLGDDFYRYKILISRDKTSIFLVTK